MNTTTLSSISVHRSLGRCALLLISLLIGLLALCQQVQSATDTPDPGGSLPVSNTADGHLALASLTTGIYNSAFGMYSLLSLTDGSFCTALGGATLILNTGSENTAVGAGALLSNTTGAANTAHGAFALFSNVGGSSNTAIGDRALQGNITGGGHTAVGFQALQNNIAPTASVPSGIGPNTAVGAGALVTNTIGNGNTAVGFNALHDNDTGLGNTAIGTFAGSSITGNFNICVGQSVSGVAGEENTIRIGDNLPDTQGDSACYVGGIFNQPIDVGSAAVVGIDNTGKLGTAASSRRFKQDIKPMDKASEAILALKPVTFHYKSDAKNTPCFGLIAEEVAEVNSDLVVRNKHGEVWSVRYEQINAMLLNEFLKEHRKVEQLEKQIEKLTAGLEKVSAQFEVSKPAPQTALNNQ